MVFIYEVKNVSLVSDSAGGGFFCVCIFVTFSFSFLKISCSSGLNSEGGGGPVGSGTF
jgi:hypothetical protein